MGDASTVKLEPQVGGERTMHLDKLERAAELSSALRTRASDAVFRAALDLAARLVT